MTQKLVALLLGIVFVAAVAPAAAAANKEHQQLMADIRMMQEQAQQLQNLLGTLNEALKAVNARLDEQTNGTRKARGRFSRRFQRICMAYCSGESSTLMQFAHATKMSVMAKST